MCAPLPFLVEQLRVDRVQGDGRPAQGVAHDPEALEPPDVLPVRAPELAPDRDQDAPTHKERPREVAAAVRGFEHYSGDQHGEGDGGLGEEHLFG